MLCLVCSCSRLVYWALYEMVCSSLMRWAQQPWHTSMQKPSLRKQERDHSRKQLQRWLHSEMTSECQHLHLDQTPRSLEVHRHWLWLSW